MITISNPRVHKRLYTLDKEMHLVTLLSMGLACMIKKCVKTLEVEVVE